MNQKQKPRLYFTNDFSPENVKKLQGQGWTLRRASAYRPGDSLEECSEVSGDVPQAYLDAKKKANGKLTVQLDVETSPALQKALDDAKAECEKVAAENTELTEQLKKERQAVKNLTDEVTDTKAILQAIEAERDALAAKLTALEAKETVIVVNETTAIGSEKIAVNAAKAAKAKT
ncbi:hypothetical protein [uncultured Acinetobacter sp.]|uniref:hypothetical protein n=1 Tax=uncultured Acinetobacter sp. TaxID=165433 RepID=UPI00261033E6|nr:hypothetical protein [uncultured Acinetobacter sp.]